MKTTEASYRLQHEYEVYDMDRDQWKLIKRGLPLLPWICTSIRDHGTACGRPGCADCEDVIFPARK